MNRKEPTTKINTNDGFTLIELAIVIVIIGLMVIPLLKMYEIYMIKEKMLITEENIDKARIPISLSYGRYPCPSDRSLKPTDPNYGREKCTGISDCTSYSSQGICRATGLRDADGDGNNDTIVIGGIPFLDESGNPISSMQASYTIDSWGNKMTYAVTENLMKTQADTSNTFKLGVVSAINEHGNPTAGTNDDAQYAILSHGKDGEGAFSIEGQYRPCVAGKTESENCDNDSVFVSALGFYEGSSAKYYDDTSYFYIRAPGYLWYNLISGAGDISPHINNSNTGNVGVNTTNPQYKLDVSGDISAKTTRTDELCDENGTNCIAASDFNDLGTCPAGQLVTAIENKTVKCDYPKLTVSSGTAQCATGKFITAILTNGCIICNDNSKVCP